MGYRKTKGLLEGFQSKVVKEYVTGLQAGLFRDYQEITLDAVSGFEQVAAGD